MLLQTVLALLVASVTLVSAENWWEIEKDAHDAAKRAIDEQRASNEKISQEITRLARQVMLQQFFTEERVRSEGSSGKVSKFQSPSNDMVLVKSIKAWHHLKLMLLPRYRNIALVFS